MSCSVNSLGLNESPQPMTTTPEGRAKDIHDRLFRLGKYHFAKVHMAPLALIAQAIREAEDAALERAAGVASSYSSEPCEDEWETGRAQAAESIAADIRALKHNKG